MGRGVQLNAPTKSEVSPLIKDPACYGIFRVCPTNMLEGSDIPFNEASAATVVPKRVAMLNNVSPRCTT